MKNMTLLWSKMNQADSNPRKWQGTLLSFFTNPIVKKSKADTKVKKLYDRNDTRKIKNEWFKQFEWLQLDNGLASDCSTSKSCESVWLITCKCG